MNELLLRRVLKATGRVPLGIGVLALVVGLGGCERSAAPAPVTVAVAASPIAEAGLITGRVASYGATGFQPVAGARVTTETGASAESDAEGRFVLRGLGAGAHTLVIEHPAHAPGERRIHAMPGTGLANANVLLASRAYGVSQAAFEAIVTGVVFDPRGAALAGADVTLDCPRAHGGLGAHLITRTNADGFFAATLANVSPGATPPAITYGASGTSPGGVPLSTETDATAELTGPRLALNIQALKFPDLPPQAIVGTAFVLPGQEGRISSDGLSVRADEFYLQLVSGDERLDALPLTAEDGQASFRMPFGLPEAVVKAVIVPFGRIERASTLSPPFITSYTEADLERDVTFSVAGQLDDLTGMPNTVNDSRFIGGDEARFTMTLANANPHVPQALELTGKLPVGTTIWSVSLGGEPATFEGPDSTGKWRILGVQMPLEGSLPLEMLLQSAGKLPNATPFALTEMALRMPILDLTRPTPPADSPVLLGGSVDKAAFKVEKAIVDDDVPGNGKGFVVLTLTPVNSLAGASFKITDMTDTEDASSDTAAAFVGTAVLPAPGVNPGFVTGEYLSLVIDGKLSQFPIFGPGYDLETLIGQINTSVGNAGAVSAKRTADGHFYLERGQQGAAKTLGISSTSSPTVLNLLGLTPGSMGSGYHALNVTARQPGGTVWTATVTNAADKIWDRAKLTLSFLLKPPAAYMPGDGPDSPITVKYEIAKLNGKPGIAGGGVGANFGAKIESFNVNYTSSAVVNDQTLNKAAPDAPRATNL